MLINRVVSVFFFCYKFHPSHHVTAFIGIVEVYKQRSKDFLQAQFPGYDSDLKGFFKAVFSAYIEGDDTILKWNDKTLKFSEEDYHHVRKHTIMVESKIAWGGGGGL